MMDNDSAFQMHSECSKQLFIVILSYTKHVSTIVEINYTHVRANDTDDEARKKRSYPRILIMRRKQLLVQR